MAESETVWILLNPADSVAAQPPVRWAVEQLRQAIKARGVAAEVVEQAGLPQVPTSGTCVVVAGRASAVAAGILAGANVSIPDVPEALGLAPGRLASRPVLLACGADARGLVYAVLELADRVAFSAEPSAALTIERPVIERPANVVFALRQLLP